MIIADQVNNHLANQRGLQEFSSNDKDGAKVLFNSVLENSLISTNVDNDKNAEKKLSPTNHRGGESEQASVTATSKPDMRELVEAISGRSVEALYADPNVNWLDVSKQATELLYGVIGSGNDTRDWQKIMNSKDVLSAARLETGLMYEPKVDILSEYDSNGEIIGQFAVLKNKDDTVLRSLSVDPEQVEIELANFGANKNTVPRNIESLIVVENFNDNLLQFFKNYSEKTNSIQEKAIKNASKSIEDRLEQDISLEKYL